MDKRIEITTANTYREIDNVIQLIVQIIFINNMVFIFWESTYLMLLNISLQQDTETAY